MYKNNIDTVFKVIFFNLIDIEIFVFNLLKTTYYSWFKQPK